MGMAKLPDLIEATSAALGLSYASVNVIAMKLRKDKLLKSAGRGIHGAEMASTDAANLIIGCLVGGQAIKVSETAAPVRLAHWIGGSVTDRPELSWKLPPLATMQAFDVSHTFADGLTAILQAYVDRGPLASGAATRSSLQRLDTNVGQSELPSTNEGLRLQDVAIAVTERATDYFCEIRFEIGEEGEWLLAYSAHREGFDIREPETLVQASDRLLKKHGGLRTTRAVSGLELAMIAACLGGSGEGSKA